MNIITDKTYDFIKTGLDVSSLREKVISNNMANINTKGYKKSNVTFEENLKEEMAGVSLKRTKKEHLDTDEGNSLVSIKKDESTSMRSDGNNVDLDLEKVNQAANTLMYNALITQANSKMNMTKSVISGGGR